MVKDYLWGISKLGLTPHAWQHWFVQELLKFKGSNKKMFLWIRIQVENQRVDTFGPIPEALGL